MKAIVLFNFLSFKKNFSFSRVYPMFYVEHYMKYLIFTLIALFLSLSLSSCVQNITNPEQSDEIYKDYIIELGLVSKLLDSEEKNLTQVLVERQSVVPQTGQIKFANKKITDAEEKITILKQQKQYFEIKIDQRARLVKSRYGESLTPSGRAWPDVEELKLYRAVTKFNRDKISWEKTKGLKKLVPRGTGADAEAAPEEKK